MIIAVDPHKSSHTATAVDEATNTPIASLRVDATLAGYRELLRWANQSFSYDPNTVWNGEGVPLHPAAERYYRERGYVREVVGATK